MILGSIIFDSTLTQLTFNKHVVSAKISNTGKVSFSVWTCQHFFPPSPLFLDSSDFFKGCWVVKSPQKALNFGDSPFMDQSRLFLNRIK